jgi:hypothetical protein
MEKPHGQLAGTQNVQNPFYLLNDNIWLRCGSDEQATSDQRVKVEHKKAPGPADQASRRSLHHENGTASLPLVYHMETEPSRARGAFEFLSA